MNSLLSWPHLPVILCLSGAVVLTAGGTKWTPRLRNGLALGIYVIVFVCLFVILSRLPIDVVFSDWLVQLMLLGSLIYRVEALNGAFALLVTLMLAAQMMLLAREDEGESDARVVPSLLVTSGATYAILFAGNLLTLLFSWTVFVAAAFLLLTVAGGGYRTALRLLIVLGVGVFLLLWATWSVGRGDGGRWAAFGSSPLALFAVFVVSWISLGAYPLHVRLPLDEGRPSVDMIAVLQVVPVVLGLYLLSHLSLVGDTLLLQELWVALAAVALIVSAQIAWAQPDPVRALSYVGVALTAGILLTVSLASFQTIGPIVQWVLCLPAALFLLFLVPPRADPEDPPWVDWLLRGVTGLAAAALVGIPPLSGFVAWAHLYRAVLSHPGTSEAIVLSVVLVSAGALISATLLRVWLAPRFERRVEHAREKGMVGAVLLLPVFLGGLLPGWSARRIVGAAGAEWGEQAYGAAPVAFAAAMMVLSLAAGYVLYRQRLSSVLAGRRVWLWVVELWKLHWLWRLFEALGRRFFVMSAAVTAILHGEHHLVWAFLVMLLFVWFYLVF